MPPGAEIIEAVNAYLRVRHQFRGKLPEAIRRQVDAVLHALVAENKDKLP